MSDVPALVTLHVWTVPARSVARAVTKLALDRPRLRRTRGLRFAKGLGTGAASFGVLDATPRRWALLATWDSAAAARSFTASPLVRGWERLAVESGRMDLHPVSSRGRWSRREPFGSPDARATQGPVVVLTRARLSPGKAMAFWRAVPPVATRLAVAPGLRLTFGVGEAPVGVQGTVSVWSSAAAVRDFAYDTPEHAEAIRRTPVEGWYAEELFARFDLLGSVGSFDGIRL